MAAEQRGGIRGYRQPSAGYDRQQHTLDLLDEGAEPVGHHEVIDLAAELSAWADEAADAADQHLLKATA